MGTDPPDAGIPITGIEGVSLWDHSSVIWFLSASVLGSCRFYLAR